MAGRKAPPHMGLYVVPCDASAPEIHVAELVLGLGVALLGKRLSMVLFAA